MHKLNDLIYIGSDADVQEFKEDHPEGRVIHAAKEPWHRNALGYTGRGAPKGDPEYLVAMRGDEMCLNLVDSPDPKWIPAEPFIKAGKYIRECYVEGIPLLIHCNQGRSRGPGVVLHDMIKLDCFPDGLSFDEVCDNFREHYYPDFEPGGGVYGFLEEVYEGMH